MIEEPLGGTGLGLLDLVLLLEGVDPVLALNVGLGRLEAVFTGVDGVGNVLPVLLTEVAAVELDVTPAPGVDQSLGGTVAPTVVSAAVVGATRVGSGHGWDGLEEEDEVGMMKTEEWRGVWVGCEASDSDPSGAIGLGGAL